MAAAAKEKPLDARSFAKASAGILAAFLVLAYASAALGFNLKDGSFDHGKSP